MLYLEPRKRNLKKILAVVTLLILGNLLSVSQIHAETISPSFTEEILVSGETIDKTVTITNDNNYDLFLTPTLYKYYPQTETISQLQPFEELVRITTDYIEIPSNSEKEINFQLVAPQALDPGTYYNLIVFTQSEQNLADSVIGASGSISHLVRIHIKQDSNSDIITNDWDSSLEVISRGIPFIKPSILKVTIFNNSPYTLTPKGEIQVVKRGGNKEPEYIKVNTDRKKVFPDQTFEHEYEVQNWYLEDIIFGKTAYIKLENGIDNNIQTQEIKIPSFTNEFLYIIASITVIILLATSIKEGASVIPEPEFSE
jgi:hypothetical protein